MAIYTKQFENYVLDLMKQNSDSMNNTYNFDIKMKNSLDYAKLIFTALNIPIEISKSVEKPEKSATQSPNKKRGRPSSK